MRLENKELRTWYIEQKKEITKRYGGEISSPDYKKEIHNLSQKVSRERKKLQAVRNPQEPQALNVPRIPFNEEALAVVISDPLEQAVIRVYLADITKAPSKIATEVGEGLSAQMVTAILNREEVKALVKNLLWQDTTLACDVAIRDGVVKKDPVWIKIAHDYGYVKGRGDGQECETCHPKPLTDPFLLEVLKTTGDLLGNIDSPEKLKSFKDLAKQFSDKLWL